MTTEETMRRIRLDIKRGGKIKQIARERHMDPKTVRKIARSESSRFEYVRKKIHYPALEPHLKDLESLLEANDKLTPRSRRPMVQIFDDLQRKGYSGGYDSVRRYIRRWKEERANAPGKTSASSAFIPLDFEAGEAYQFDWSTNYIVINGVVTQIKVAHVTLAHSRMSFARIYRRETLEMVLDAHEQAFKFFEGVCLQGIYDNMTTAVTKVLMHKKRIWNLQFDEYCAHQGIEPVACNPASGWEKGRVERHVQTDRIDFFKPTPKTEDESLEEINRLLLNRVIEQARRRKHPEKSDKSVWEVFLEERKELLPLSEGFVTGVEHQRSCSKTCLVNYDKNQYSAHYTASGRSVQVMAIADQIVIRHNGTIVAQHQRCFKRESTIFDYRHYIGVLDRKPGAIRHGAPFKGDHMPKTFQQVWQHLKGRDRGDREFANILAAVVQYNQEIVLEACDVSLREGTVSEAVILNYILRKIDNSSAVPEEMPIGFWPELKHSPESSCEEYNHLLKGRTNEPNHHDGPPA